MPLDIPWPFPDNLPRSTLKSRFWRLGTSVTLFSCGALSKFWLQTLNKTTVYNYDDWIHSVEAREKGKALVTICNHTSNIDDPLVFGLLPFRLAFSPSSLRWGLGASNVCFTKPSHGTFCALGKIIPVVRGDGVYQRGMDMLLERMNAGDWAHVFPEGQVNMSQEWMRLKWGLGRLIADCRVPPIVLPFWHEGLTDVLPHKLPYRLRTGNKVTVVFGRPVDTRELLHKLRSSHDTVEGLRKALTDYFQNELALLREKTRKIHFDNSFDELIDGDRSLADANVTASNSADETRKVEKNIAVSNRLKSDSTQNEWNANVKETKENYVKSKDV